MEDSLKVSEKQLLVLLDALQGSCCVVDGCHVFVYDQETRKKFFKEIVNQQSDALVDVKGEEPKEVGR